MRVSIILFVAIICFLTVGLLAINQLAFIPYNVRELVVTDYPVVSSLLFSCFMTWTFGFTTFIALWFHSSSKKLWSFFCVLIAHGLVSWFLLRYAVPMESIHDIVGSPVLFWPWEFELIGRFLALFFIVTFTVSFSALLCFVMSFGVKKNVLLKYLVYGIGFSSISHFVVFEKAATDNLTELIASGGTLLSSFLLILFLIILSFVSSQFALFVSKINLVSRWGVLLSGFMSFPVAFFCIYFATESSILKYGQKFSSLQFLLSTDRKHLVETPELLIRYAIVHTSLVLIIALVQIPFWLWIAERFRAQNSTGTNEI